MQNSSRAPRALALRLSCLILTLVVSSLISAQILKAAPVPQMNQGAGFVGQWCAQGDPNKQTSITSNGGVFFNLTNETGDTSPGTLQGPNVMSAPGWQFVTGVLGSLQQRRRRRWRVAPSADRRHLVSRWQPFAALFHSPARGHVSADQ
jgi:hypothetical protein